MNKPNFPPPTLGSVRPASTEPGPAQAETGSVPVPSRSPNAPDIQRRAATGAEFELPPSAAQAPEVPEYKKLQVVDCYVAGMLGFAAHLARSNPDGMPTIVERCRKSIGDGWEDLGNSMGTQPGGFSELRDFWCSRFFDELLAAINAGSPNRFIDQVQQEYRSIFGASPGEEAMTSAADLVRQISDPRPQ